MLPRMRRPTRSAGPEKLPHHEEEGRVDCTGKRRVVEKTRGGSGDKIKELETELWNQPWSGLGPSLRNTNRASNNLAMFSSSFRNLRKTEGLRGTCMAFAPQIHGMVAATKPTTIQSVVLKVGVSTDEVTSIL
ncbi:hypothetical protein Tco_0794776 [Tanacetum coccineum]